jgi:hypothetical protein
VKCGTPIPANPDEVAWVCGQCQQGNLLDEIDGLKAVTINYSAGIQPGGLGRPYWVVEGQVTLVRSTYRGSDSREADEFWAAPRQFFIPAFACPLDFLLQIGTKALTQPPDCREGPPMPCDPIVLRLEDVRSAVEFIIVGIEAGRRDKMKTIEFSLDLSEPVLWVLP